MYAPVILILVLVLPNFHILVFVLESQLLFLIIVLVVQSLFS